MDEPTASLDGDTGHGIVGFVKNNILNDLGGSWDASQIPFTNGTGGEPNQGASHTMTIRP